MNRRRRRAFVSISEGRSGKPWRGHHASVAVTDRFSKGYAVSDTRSNQLLARIKAIEYDRAYYAGILAERRAKAKLAQGTPGAAHVAYHELCEAMQQFEKAEKIRPTGNDDALLRWNTCARIIERNHWRHARRTEASRSSNRVSERRASAPTWMG